MKKIYNSLFIAGALIASGFSNQTLAQGDCDPDGGCPFNLIEQWPAATIDIQSTSFVFATEESYIGDHMVFLVNSGVTYTWSLCPADGGVASAEAQDATFKLFKSSDQSFLCMSDDFCELLPRIEWTADFSGTVTLQFNIFGELGCEPVPMVNNTIVFKADQITGVEEAAKAESIDVYPNPASDFITINYNKRSNANVMVTMISADGRVVFSGNQVAADGFVKIIDVSTFAAGLYFVQLTSEEGTVNKRVIVQ